jgi:hypothetical protein
MSILNQKQRDESATITVNGEAKFPIPDKAHARAALARIDQAKPPLTPEQKATVEAKAHRVLGLGHDDDIPAGSASEMFHHK